MSVLSSVITRAFLGLTIVGLAGCERGSPQYQRIEELPHSQWISYAESLPLDQRLSLHKEIMERSSHNPVMTISEAFDDEPKNTYDLIVKRLKGGDKNRHYLLILYEINRQKDFKICNQEDRRIVQNYLWRISTDAVEPGNRVNFYTC